MVDVKVNSFAVTRLSLEDATAKDLAAATRALLQGKHHTTPNAVREALHALIRRASSALSEVQVHERDGYVSFTHAPVAALAAFGHAVASGKALAQSKTKATARKNAR